MIAKAEYRELTPDERVKLIQSFEECMTLLEKLDARENEHFYREYRRAFNAIEAKRR